MLDVFVDRRWRFRRRQRCQRRRRKRAFIFFLNGFQLKFLIRLDQSSLENAGIFQPLRHSPVQEGGHPRASIIKLFTVVIDSVP
jgi:hypothetical protein